MGDATGEVKQPSVRVAFDRRIKLEFHGARITSDGGLLAYRKLDDALGLTAMAASTLAEGRRGKNIQHQLLGLLRQAVYGRLAGYEDVNDAERLARDPAMRAIVGREGIDRPAALGAPVITRCSCSTSLVTWSAAGSGPATSIALRTGTWCWSR